jgi:hypothetical protein
MTTINSKQAKTVNVLKDLLARVTCVQPNEVKIVGQDEFTGSLLMTFAYDEGTATVWVRTNGSAASRDGYRILNAGGAYPKKITATTDQIFGRAA